MGDERKCGYVQCRLDRALGNTEWFQLLPRVHGEYLQKIGSDHRPVLLRFKKENMSRTGCFMLDKRWVSKPEVKEIIRKSWSGNANDTSGSLHEKIAECRRALSRWKHGADCNSKNRIQRLKEEIDTEGSKRHPDKRVLKDKKWELAQAYREEEIYWKQRSKEQWM